MNSRKASAPAAVNASLIALVIVLAVLLYVFGASMSGESNRLSQTVRGAIVFDTREVAN